MPSLPSTTLPVLAAGLLSVCANASAPVTTGDDAALKIALEDEYRAEATYAAVIDSFGEVRPFINIIEAERRHATRVRAEMTRLAIAYDAENPFMGTIEAPATLLEACELGIEAERENIALYDRILPTIEDDGVRATLSDLQWASRERHLPAFERCVARGGSMGRGRRGN